MSSRSIPNLIEKNQVKIFNYSDDYSSDKPVPGERLAAFCLFYHRRDVQNSTATSRENPSEEGSPSGLRKAPGFRLICII